MSTTGITPMPQAALQAQGLSVQLGGMPRLSGVDVAVPQGAWTAMVGPNGAGKSTLLRALAGLHPRRAQQGAVWLAGQPLVAWTARERAQHMAWLGQNEAVGDDLLCYDVVMLGRLPHQGWLAGPSAHDHAAVEQALCDVHAWQWRHRALSELSGGERQRVLLARALAVQAPLLLMDEPLANLDPPHQSDWMALVQTLVAQGRTVVSVLHELGIALQADYLLVMQQGRVLHMGPGQAPDTHAALEQVFDHRIRIRAVDGVWTALPV